jgi:hypothetical protein
VCNTVADGRRAPAPRWCPTGLTKMQTRLLQKLRQRGIAERHNEEERDNWFNRACPMVPTWLTWKEKRLVKEDDSGSNSEDTSTQLAEEEVNIEKDRIEISTMEVNMVFILSDEFCLPGSEVAELNLGAERDVFEKPERVREHMKLLFIKGHLDGILIGRMVIDGGASVNIMPLWMFEKLGHHDEDLKKTNLSLSGFLGEPAEARGIVSKELTVGSKIVPTTFFMVDIKGRYNVLLG